ncbi:MAG: hypothetical protein AAFR61_31485 [Bacteroidota bacterium]
MDDSAFLDRIKAEAEVLSQAFLQGENKEYQAEIPVQHQSSVSLNFSHTHVVVEDARRKTPYYMVRFEIRVGSQQEIPIYHLDFEFSPEGELWDAFYLKV